jgi:cobyrinic acid a,c-diamide synthase
MVTAALARFHTSQGRRVRVFKAGPDFLDSMILAHACGHPAYQLDLWMAGQAQCQQLLHTAAGEADLILIEGVMGLFDGEPSSADLAERFGVPVVAVIDAAGTAQTLGAVAHGLATYRPTVPFAGVLANSVASPRHAQMIEQGIAAPIRYLGGMPRNPNAALPTRHLGLVQANEVCDLDARLDQAAVAIGMTKLATLPPAISFAPATIDTVPPLLAGVRIGIARDAAFSFIYQANLDLLRQLGAELRFFSPLVDRDLPDVDSVYLPGGYPELHLEQLQNNRSMQAALQQHVDQHKPLYAECGGMLYLMTSLTDRNSQLGALCDILPGHAVMKNRLQGLGYQSAPMSGGVLRAHTFHHSVIDSPLEAIAYGERLHATSFGEKIFQLKRLTATYLHCYFPSNPTAAAALFLP